MIDERAFDSLSAGEPEEDNEPDTQSAHTVI
jgi:hypothetical protein